MKKLTLNVLFFAAAFVLCLTFSTNFAYGQSATAQELDSCGGVSFNFVLTEIPGQNGNKQQVEVIVKNTNSFRVHVSLKFRAISNEGGKYDSIAIANSYNAGTSGRISTFVPFGEVDLTRNDYPKIAQIGLVGVDVRNVENLGNTPGAYSRGAKIGGACGGKLKEIAAATPNGVLFENELNTDGGAGSNNYKETTSVKVFIEKNRLNEASSRKVTYFTKSGEIYGTDLATSNTTALISDLDGQSITVSSGQTVSGNEIWSVNIDCKNQSECVGVEGEVIQKPKPNTPEKYTNKYKKYTFSFNSQESAMNAEKLLRKVIK